MDKMKSTQEFGEKIAAFQKNHEKFVTNCYFMQEETAELISNGKLYLFEHPGILLLLCDRTDYCNLYHYIAGDTPLPDFPSIYGEIARGRDVLLDHIYSENRPSESSLLISRLLSGRIIRKYKCYQRMAMKLSDYIFFHSSYGLPEKYRLAQKPPQYPEVTALWKTALDEKSTPLPDAAQFEELLKKGLLSCIENVGNGKLCAAATLNFNGKQGMLQHLAVLPEHRRQGLAGFLCERVIMQAIQSQLKVLKLWVDTQNGPAIALYRREGFSPDSILCGQYLFERNL